MESRGRRRVAGANQGRVSQPSMAALLAHDPTPVRQTARGRGQRPQDHVGLLLSDPEAETTQAKSKGHASVALHAASTEMNRLQDALQDAQKENQRLTTQLANSLQAAKQSRLVCEEIMEQRDEAEQQLAALRLDQRTAVNTAAAHGAEAEAAVRSALGLKQQTLQQDESIKALKKENDQLKYQLAQTQVLLDTEQADKARQVTQLQNQVTQLKQQLSDRIGLIQKSQERIDELRSEVQELTKTNNALQKQKDFFKKARDRRSIAFHSEQDKRVRAEEALKHQGVVIKEHQDEEAATVAAESVKQSAELRDQVSTQLQESKKLQAQYEEEVVQARYINFRRRKPRDGHQETPLRRPSQEPVQGGARYTRAGHKPQDSMGYLLTAPFSQLEEESAVDDNGCGEPTDFGAGDPSTLRTRGRGSVFTSASAYGMHIVDAASTEECWTTLQTEERAAAVSADPGSPVTTTSPSAMIDRASPVPDVIEVAEVQVDKLVPSIPSQEQQQQDIGDIQKEEKEEEEEEEENYTDEHKRLHADEATQQPAEQFSRPEVEQNASMYSEAELEPKFQLSMASSDEEDFDFAFRGTPMCMEQDGDDCEDHSGSSEEEVDEQDRESMTPTNLINSLNASAILGMEAPSAISTAATTTTTTMPDVVVLIDESSIESNAEEELRLEEQAVDGQDVGGVKKATGTFTRSRRGTVPLAISRALQSAVDMLDGVLAEASATDVFEPLLQLPHGTVSRASSSSAVCRSPSSRRTSTSQSQSQTPRSPGPRTMTLDGELDRDVNVDGQFVNAVVQAIEGGALSELRQIIGDDTDTDVDREDGQEIAVSDAVDVDVDVDGGITAINGLGVQEGMVGTAVGEGFVSPVKHVFATSATSPSSPLATVWKDTACDADDSSPCTTSTNTTFHVDTGLDHTPSCARATTLELDFVVDSDGSKCEFGDDHSLVSCYTSANASATGSPRVLQQSNNGSRYPTRSQTTRKTRRTRATMLDVEVPTDTENL
eukprot:m.292285 g.292285  ORF g.292285 m.292285 type:complete len:1001 (+) comp15838_c0_seq1:45-3047(+)